MAKYSCDQLGVCHCGHCADWFGLPAPKRPPSWRRAALTALRWAWHLLSALCVVIVIAGSIGMVRANAEGEQFTTCICEISPPPQADELPPQEQP